MRMAQAAHVMPSTASSTVCAGAEAIGEFMAQVL